MKAPHRTRRKSRPANPLTRPTAAKLVRNRSRKKRRTTKGKRALPTASTATTSRVDVKSKTRSVANGKAVKMAAAKYQPQSDETKIDVFVRCRGRNEKELRENSSVIVKTDGVKGKTLELSMGANSPNNKTYSFDRVFSQLADQQMIFDEIVVPVLEEVRKGFNCTIFAYGQTGTGKTYTMSGDLTDRTILSDDAGIIPRVLRSIFQGLDVMPNSVANGNTPESSVKVSFIELYNEELRDLLSTDEKSTMKIFDGDGKKGGGTIVQGMEEQYITSARTGLDLLRRGSHKRQVAATKCNDLSSRSHTIFTLTVYTKKTLPSGEEILSSGKLNLVDLAGSENIGRSGAENKRATEAGLINKSLLTLGRVINALVDRSSHIPYRESKLTRILQDSLGGRTKTCIIATLSPARLNLEETISSLDYAFRAKNIRNKPQINQMIPKWTFLKDFTAEIERLKSELAAARQRNGVYLAAEAYDGLVSESESLKLQVKEQQEKLETIESKLSRKGQDLLELAGHFDSMKKDNDIVRESLEGTKSLLEVQKSILAHTKQSLMQETQARQQQERTVKQLSQKNRELADKLKRSTTENTALHRKLRRTSELQARNQEQHQTMQNDVSATMSTLDDRLRDFQREQQKLLTILSDTMQTTVDCELDELGKTRTMIKEQTTGFERLHTEFAEISTKERDRLSVGLNELKIHRARLETKMADGLTRLDTALSRIPQGVLENIQSFHAQLQLSYTKLGEDYKTVFDDMRKEMDSKGESLRNLHEDMTRANRSLHETQTTSVDDLSDFVVQEKARRSEETESLIKRIQELVEMNVQQQELRLTTIERETIRMKSSLDGHAVKDISFADSSDQLHKEWTRLGNDLQQIGGEMTDRLQNDYAMAVQQTETLRAAATDIHDETSQIVKEQRQELVKDLDILNIAIDEVQVQNNGFGINEAERLSAIAEDRHIAVRDLNGSLRAATERFESLNPILTANTDQLSHQLSQLDPQATIRSQISDLHHRSDQARLEKDISTGQTPARGNHRSQSASPQTPLSESGITETIRLDLPGQDLGSPRRMSPSKMHIFVDEHETSTLPSKDMRTAVPASPRPSTAPELRELDVNSMIRGTENQTITSIKSTTVCAEKEDCASDKVIVKPSSLKRPAVVSASLESKVPAKTRRLRNTRVVSVPLNVAGAVDLSETENRAVSILAHKDSRKHLSSSTSRRLRSSEKLD